jgi:hypothetical protein
MRHPPVRCVAFLVTVGTFFAVSAAAQEKPKGKPADATSPKDLEPRTVTLQE